MHGSKFKAKKKKSYVMILVEMTKKKKTYTKFKLGRPSINPQIVITGECVMRRFPILYLLVGAYFCFANLHIHS